MSEPPNDEVDVTSAPDPVVAAALASMTPPPHGATFWAAVDWRLRAEGPPATAGPAAPPPPPPVGPPPPAALRRPEPPLAEITPLAPPPNRFPRWPALVAAAVVVVLGAALLARTTPPDVETTAASSSLPAPTTVLATTTVPAPTSTAPAVPAPVTTRPTVAPTTSAPPTTVRSPLTATPDALGPLRIGMTTKETEATGAMGPFEDPLDTGGACGYANPAGAYQKEDFGALFLDGRLARLYFGAGSRVRTPEGVAAGSASTKLRSVAGTRSESPHPYGGGTNVQILRGGVGYLFTVAGGKVTEWSVGTVEGLSLPEGCA